ncbi:hypothetical protein TI39_contig692g00002 [Zymoseptoria brevis]|uniref:Uncharacterized protein n=3 Tax=Zymoseptoria TaxID=1047167 RepID=A0A0F4GJ68_9PEZI|nr:hypothetical protein TI39_contig692g00002 [Zymoseptoria brevis]
MKFSLAPLLILGLAAGVMAKDQTQQVIISYPNNTPASVLEGAKKAILDAGGVITHEYSLIMGFAAKVPAKVLESVQAMGQEHNVLIEQDQIVSINN